MLLASASLKGYSRFWVGHAIFFSPSRNFFFSNVLMYLTEKEDLSIVFIKKEKNKFLKNFWK